MPTEQQLHADSPLRYPPVPDPADVALFLDVDGTLLDFAQTPDAVTVSDGLRELLTRLERACDGAIALVSGRSLEALDRLFGPLELPLAGSHGLEIRTDHRVHTLGIPLPEDASESMRALADAHPGSLLEPKRFGAALHFRRAPDHGPALTAAMRTLADELGDAFELIEGNHVLELTAANGDKGSAIRFLCARDPWRGRRPVFIGDDTTDEPGFAVVNEMDGLAVRVGTRPNSAARWQLDSIAAVKAWLRSLATG